MKGKKKTKTTSTRGRHLLTLYKSSLTRNYQKNVPRETKICMQYFEIFNGSTVASLTHDRLFNLNSIYDPNRTGVGHQASSLDQWIDFYNRYRVDKTKVTVTWTEVGAKGGFLALVPSNETATFNDPSVVCEANRVSFKHMTPTGNATRISRTYDLAALTGVSRAQYKIGNQYQSILTSDPAETMVLHVCTTDVGLGAVTFAYTVHIQYYVTLFDPNNVPLS